MDRSRIEEELNELKAKTHVDGSPPSSLPEHLFHFYQRLEDQMTQDEGDADGLVAAQSIVMGMASRHQARSIRELLYKFALWRWDAPDLDLPADEITRYDEVALSAFRDLADLMAVPAVLKQGDNFTRPHAEAEADHDHASRAQVAS